MGCLTVWIQLLALTLLTSHSYALPGGPDVTASFNPADGRTILWLGLAMTACSAVGTIYVFIRTYCRWRKGNRRLSMAVRLPFYTACTDFLLVVVYFVNMTYSAVNLRVWPGSICRAVAASVFFCDVLNMSMVGVVALVTYLRVCRKIYFQLGPYDYKLFGVAVTNSALLTMLVWQYLGPSTYWCLANRENKAFFVISLVLIFNTLAISLFCYLSTICEITQIDWNKYKGNRSERQEARVDARVTRKVVTYVLIFIIQWTPSLPYIVCQLADYDQPWIYILSVIFVNFGGIGNCLQYGMNEGWWSDKGTRLRLSGVEEGEKEESGGEIMELEGVKERDNNPISMGPPLVSVGVETQYVQGFDVGVNTQAEFEYQQRIEGGKEGAKQ